MTTSSRKSRLVLLALLGVLVLTVVPMAIAGKGGDSRHGGNTGSTSGLSLVMVSDANRNGLPNHGDTVTFNVTTTVTTEPVVALSCYQNAKLVYSSSAGFYAGYAYPWLQDFILGSTAWSSGAADCTATLEYFNGKRMAALATLSFHAGA